MRRCLITLLLVTGTLLTPSVAAAGQITVHTCKYPDNTLVPVFADADFTNSASFGWGNRYAVPTNQSCANGQQMIVGNPGGDLNLNEWVFKIPASAQILSFTIDRTLESHSAPATDKSDYYLIANDNQNSDSEVNTSAGTFSPSGQVFQACTVANGTIGSYPTCGNASGVFTYTPADPASTHYIHAAEWCDYNGGSCTASRTVINRLAVRIQDNNAPSGAVLDSSSGAQDLKGTDFGVREFRVVAADAQTGLLSAHVLIDGAIAVGPTAFPQASNECADKYSGAGGDGYDYNTPVPCPTAGNVTLSYDTTSLPVGSHTVQVVITDAAGNQTVIGREITVPATDGTSTPETFVWDKTEPLKPCSNGLDDDNDAKVDRDDPGCHRDGNPANPDSYDPNDLDETDPFPLCTSVKARFAPGRFERRYTRVSKTGKTAITSRRKAKKYAGKSTPRIRIRGKLIGAKNCVAYWRIGKTTRLVSKRTSSGAFTEFYFEGLKSGSTSFRAEKNKAVLHVKRRA